jgi:hypothetical protein
MPVEENVVKELNSVVSEYVTRVPRSSGLMLVVGNAYALKLKTVAS